MLDVVPAEFTIDEYGWHCKLAFVGNKTGKYKLWINDTLVSDLPLAPPLTTDDIPSICRSDNLVYQGQAITRVTFHLFIDAQLHHFVA